MLELRRIFPKTLVNIKTAFRALEFTARVAEKVEGDTELE